MRCPELPRWLRGLIPSTNHPKPIYAPRRAPPTPDRHGVPKNQPTHQTHHPHNHPGCTYCCIQGCDTCLAFPALNVTDVHARVHDGHGFVALDAAHDTLFLAFTGTDPLALRDYWDDLDFARVAFPGCDGCWVHRGFYHTYLELREQVLAAVDGHLEAHPTAAATIHVTGHSMGGALAVFASLELVHTLGLRPTKLYTFGQPRIGNDAFRTFVQGSLAAASCAHFRVTHHRDPIPHLPPQQPLGFRHEPQEVFYPAALPVPPLLRDSSSSPPYVVCSATEGEDPQGSNQYRVALNLVDHVTYLGFPFTLNYLQCDVWRAAAEENHQEARR